MSLKKISLLTLVAVFGFVLSAPVFAQNSEGGSGLQISPTRSDVSAQPGESKTISVTVKNITQGELTAQGVVNDFESDNVSGTPKIIVEQDKTTPYSIKKMIDELESFDLKPGETKQVQVPINVPSDAAPGAYFGVVRYIAVPKGQEVSADNIQVSLTASVAHLVFLEVPGEVLEQIKLESLKISTGSGTSGKILFNKPTKSEITIRNLGNGFSRPFGNVAFFKSGKEVSKYEVNTLDPKGIVLPNSTRVFADEVKNINTPGKYKAVASVAYGNGGEVVNYEVSFWYLPLWFVALIAFIVIALVVGGYIFYRRKIGGSTKKSKKD